MKVGTCVGTHTCSGAYIYHWSSSTGRDNVSQRVTIKVSTGIRLTSSRAEKLRWLPGYVSLTTAASADCSWLPQRRASAFDATILWPRPSFKMFEVAWLLKQCTREWEVNTVAHFWASWQPGVWKEAELVVELRPHFLGQYVLESGFRETKLRKDQ